VQPSVSLGRVPAEALARSRPRHVSSTERLAVIEAEVRPRKRDCSFLTNVNEANVGDSGPLHPRRHETAPMCSTLAGPAS